MRLDKIEFEETISEFKHFQQSINMFIVGMIDAKVIQKIISNFVRFVIDENWKNKYFCAVFIPKWIKTTRTCGIDRENQTIFA